MCNLGAGLTLASMVLLVVCAPTAAQVSKEIQLESDPPGAAVMHVVGTRRDLIGTTPTKYRLEFHSEMSIVSLEFSKAGYETRSVDVSAKDTRLKVQLTAKRLTPDVASIADPKLRSLQEQVNPAIASVVREDFKNQGEWQLDVAGVGRLVRVGDKIYLALPFTITHAPQEFSEIGRANADQFLSSLWAPLGAGVALPLSRRLARLEALHGLVLDVDYSGAQAGFGGGVATETRIDMECQAGMVEKPVFDSCATHQSVSHYDAQSHNTWYTYECAPGTAMRPVLDPCATRVPVSRSQLVANPQVTFEAARSKVRFVVTVTDCTRASSATQLYSNVGGILIDETGDVIAKHGKLETPLIPKH